jgi:hypothetical protein
MSDKIGTVRREDHEDGYSLWLLMQNWNEDVSTWRCVYSTAPGNVGHIWLTDISGGQEIAADTRIVGSLPGILVRLGEQGRGT